MLEDVLSNFMNIVGGVFNTVFDWIFDFIFGFFGLFVTLGKNAYTAISSFVSNTLFSGDIIYIFLGAFIFFYLFRIVINIIRG